MMMRSFVVKILAGIYIFFALLIFTIFYLDHEESDYYYPISTVRFEPTQKELKRRQANCEAMATKGINVPAEKIEFTQSTCWNGYSEFVRLLRLECNNAFIEEKSFSSDECFNF
ncbi:MAG: hypothetical protein EOP04_09265 [Proteobacteria bacterium]|nr:MAG: hypothetical protein EOP04_09265 [Pseudomonadota bacterium]